MFGTTGKIWALNFIFGYSLAQRNLDDLAVENFRKYLKIPSFQSNVNYTDCIKLLLNLADNIGLECKIYEIHANKPILVIKWPGSNTSLPSILLNSHMDVVAADEKYWKYPPFDAHVDENENIYGRGSQDSKAFGIQYLEAIRRLKLEGQKLQRSVYVSFVPDEEIGGELGMKEFVKTEDFRQMNVGFAMDEGLSSTQPNKLKVIYWEKISWRFWVICKGPSGHGSGLPNDTAAEKLDYIIGKFMQLRKNEQKKLKNPNVTLANVTTINLTQLRGGTQMNVIPNELRASFDVRIEIGRDLDELEKLFEKWRRNAGDGVSYEYVVKTTEYNQTVLNDQNFYWKAVESSLIELGYGIERTVFQGTSDSRFLRQVGIPTIGFAPIDQVEMLAHENNEFLNKKMFLKGIEIYKNILTSLDNVRT